MNVHIRESDIFIGRDWKDCPACPYHNRIDARESKCDTCRHYERQAKRLAKLKEKSK